jgi:hypothetical protein
VQAEEKGRTQIVVNTHPTLPVFLKYFPIVKVGGLDCTNIFLPVFKEIMHQPPGFQTMISYLK